MFEADSSRRGVSIELPATHTMRAFWRCSLPSLSKYTTPVILPAVLCSMRDACDSGRISKLPVASALGISVYNVDRSL